MEHSSYKISSEREIENLIAQYTHYLDAANFAGVAGLFKYGKIISDGLVADGTAHIEQHLTENLQVYPNGTPHTAHVTTNTVLKIDADDQTATASSYMTIFQQDLEREFPLQPIIIGRYEDTFARVDGIWWFKERNLLMSLLGDYTHHARPDGQSSKNLHK
jgi:hypothetical protein